MEQILYTPILWLKTIIRHLWLSVSSINFYVDIYRVYKGYGFKYILSLSFLSSFICTIYLITNIAHIENKLQYEDLNAEKSILHQVISQFPDINYSGNAIEINGTTPFYIYNPKNNKKLIAIDPENTLSHQEKQQIPMILSSKKITVNFMHYEGSVSDSSMSYTQILGNDPDNITQEDIRSIIMKLLNQGYRIFTYVVFPASILLLFINAILQKSILIILIYVISIIFNLRLGMETTIRMVLFASGVYVLLQPIIFIVLPSATTILWIIQFWANILMIMALFKMRTRDKII